MKYSIWMLASIVLLGFTTMVAGIEHEQTEHQYITREAFKLLLKSYPQLANSEIATYIGTNETNSSGKKSWGAGTIVSGAWIEDEYDIVYHYGIGNAPDNTQWLADVLDFFKPSNERTAYTSITHFWDADGGLNAPTNLGDMADGIKWSFSCKENAMQKMYKYLNGDFNNRFVWDGTGGFPDLGCFYIADMVDFSMGNLFELYNKTKKITAQQYLSASTLEWNPTNCPTVDYPTRYVYEQLGRMCHLLEDMSVPAHVHCVPHACTDGMYCDYYENNALSFHQWTADEVYANGGTYINPYNSWGDPLYYLMYFMNEITDHYATGRADGDDNYDVNCPGLSAVISSLGLPITQSQINDVNCRAMHDKLMPMVIQATAGLLYWFAKETNQIPPLQSFTINVSRVFEFDQTETLQPQNSGGGCIAIFTPATYIKNGRQYSFIGWSDGDNSNPKIVCSNMNVSASYKMVHASGNATAFSNNSQRKLVQTHDGWLHQVYESMGRVWLEHSTDHGITWFLGNNSQPLDNGAGKNPSIDWHYNDSDPNNPIYNAIVVAFQQPSGSTYTIPYAIFVYTNGSYVRQSQWIPGPLYTEPAGGDQYATTNANPNIAWGNHYNFALSFERKTTVGTMQPGIYWTFGSMWEVGVYPDPSNPIPYPYYYGPVLLSGTTVNSTNATLNINKSRLFINEGDFDIVYQQGTSSIMDVIAYCIYNNGWQTDQYPFGALSSSTGISNYKPSMVQMPDGNIRVCWIRDLNGNGSAPYNVNVVYWNSAAPSQYSMYGFLAQSVSLNVRDDNAKTFYAFSQNSMFGQWENYISNGSSYVKLSTTGNDVQLSNGPLSGSNTNMYVSSFYNTTLPYYFMNAGAIGTQLQKNSSDQISCGRGAVLGKGDFQFSYSLKNLSVDNNNIKFVAIPETPTYKIPDSLSTDHLQAIKAMRKWEVDNQRYSKLDSLNTVLLSEPFYISGKSKMILSEQAGFLDTSAAANVLGNNHYVAYKLELIDKCTNKTIATIKESKFTSRNLSSCKLSSYSVNTCKVGTKMVRVRITLSTNIHGLQGALVNEYGTIDFGALAKSTVNEITLQGSEIIEEYALEQNYPNPFNPSTTVRYQIPNAGHVILKVYDMLGREVATLVNQDQEQGRYTATFDASRLASGVYISRLTAGNYTKTMKMVLMK